MSNSGKGWTAERRKRQSEAIKRWQPWEKSTGPTSPAGKAKSAVNANKGGLCEQLRELGRVMREQRDSLRKLRE